MEIVKWGLSGCGDISRKRVAPAMRDLDIVDFVGVNRARFELAEAFAEEFGARKTYRKFSEMLADKEIHAVYIATPVNMHCEMTIAAAKAGKHVLCEKPMGLTTEECDKMIAACDENNVMLGVAYYRHFYPAIARIKAILESEEIGKAVFAQINAFEFFNPSPDDDRHWFVKKDIAGGGPMFDFGSHRIEVLLNVFGELKETNGFIDSLRFQREVEDTGTAHFRFKSGVNAVLNVTHAAYESQDTFDIFATDGSIHVDNLNGGTLKIISREVERVEVDGVEVEPVEEEGVELERVEVERIEKCPPHENIHQPLVEDFSRALIYERNPDVSGIEGREVNKVEEDIFRK